tara:strand:- start:4354 stop:4674 length:321 start_codon:yes stop_codon:yes gene_type:complete
MFENHSMKLTPVVSNAWSNKGSKKQINLLNEFLIKNDVSEIKVVKSDINGFVEIEFIKNIKISERGIFLLNIESKIKQVFDEGLTLWCTPLGDKNSLRNLRGIKIK